MSKRQQIEKLYALGSYAEAVPLAEAAVDEAAAEHGRDHAETARAMNDLAVLYDAMARYGEATTLYREALAIREQQLGEEHPDTATSLVNLAHACYRQGN